MFRPTIYKRPHVYKSSAYKRYSVYNGAGVYKLPYGSPQEWTKTNVPAGVQTLHDFGDGAGPVPAIPTDVGTDVSEILSMTAIKSVYQDTMSSDKSEILSMEVQDV